MHTSPDRFAKVGVGASMGMGHSLGCPRDLQGPPERYVDSVTCVSQVQASILAL